MIWKKLRNLKAPLKELNRLHFSHVTTCTKEAKSHNMVNQVAIEFVHFYKYLLGTNSTTDPIDLHIIAFGKCSLQKLFWA